MQVIGIIPYIWPMTSPDLRSGYAAFPFIRIIGTYLCSATVPIIQVVKAEALPIPRVYIIICHTLCLVGVIMVVIGHVGSFALIQALSTQAQVYVWLVLEIVLMCVRLLIWAQASGTSFHKMRDFDIGVFCANKYLVKFDLPEISDAGSISDTTPNMIQSMARANEIRRNAAHAGLPNIDFIADHCRMAWITHPSNGKLALLYLDDERLWGYLNNAAIQVLFLITEETAEMVAPVPSSYAKPEYTVNGDEVETKIADNALWKIDSKRIRRKVLSNMDYFSDLLNCRQVAYDAFVVGDIVFARKKLVEDFKLVRSPAKNPQICIPRTVRVGPASC